MALERVGSGEEIAPLHDRCDERRAGFSQRISDAVGSAKRAAKTAEVFSKDGIANRRRGPRLAADDRSEGGESRPLAGTER